MKCHRDTCREYAQIYQTKLTSKKVPVEIEARLTDCEKKLDIFNLVRIRQQIEMEVERLAEKQKSLKAKQGWFGFLWGTTATEDTEDLNSAAAIMRKFEEAMTPQEKEKLYRAIDYQENSTPAHYPETYEMIDTRFYLHGLQITIFDNDKETPEVLDLQFNGVKAAFKSRPASSGILIRSSINDMKLLGVKQANTVPSLFNSDSTTSNGVLLDVSYEKNPLDKLCGDRFVVKSKSVHIIYDAQTIIELVKLFKVQNQSTLNQIQAAAAERLEGLKEMSALGLEYAIQKHSILDIQVDMEASKLIIPHSGFYNNTESLIAINLGGLKIHSLEKPKNDMATATVKQLVNMGKSEEDILTHLRQFSYDQFVLEIVNFQVLVASSNEDWRGALSKVEHSMTILQPTTLEIQFHKCLISDDPVLPKMRIIGQLPSLALNIADSRLLKALAIAQSIPFPEDDMPELERMPFAKSVSQLSLFKDLTTVQNEKKKSTSVVAVKQTTDLEAKFVMKKFTLSISKQENDTVTPFIRVEVLQVEAEMLQHTYDQEVMLRLGGVQVKQYHDKGDVFLINTPMSSGKEEYLIVVQYVNVNKNSPELTTRHGSVVKLLNLEFTTLNVVLHQEVIINILKFASHLQDKMSATTAMSSQDRGDRIGGRTQLAVIQEDTSTFIKDQIKKQKTSTPRHKRTVVEHIDLKIKAKIGTISLQMISDFRDISAFYIEGIAAGFIMKASYSQANVSLASVNIKDLNEASIYKNVSDAQAFSSLYFFKS